MSTCWDESLNDIDSKKTKNNFKRTIFIDEDIKTNDTSHTESFGDNTIMGTYEKRDDYENDTFSHKG